MRRQSMQEYQEISILFFHVKAKQGISILFFSSQSKASVAKTSWIAKW